MPHMTHRERVTAALAGAEVDRTPISIWRHFGAIDMTSAGLADAMVGFQDEYDWDFVKFMPTGTYAIMDWGGTTEWHPNFRGIRDVTQLPVRSTKDWARLSEVDTGTGVFGMVNEALADTVSRVGRDVPVLQTIFSPLSVARKMADAQALADMRKEPETFRAGLETIAATTERLIRDAVDRGADIFYVMQCGTADILTKDEFDEFELSYARRLLATVPDGVLTVLHSHGDHLWFEELLDLPVAGVNWHDQTAYPSLSEARSATTKGLLGGINGATLFRDGTGADVTSAIRAAQASARTGLVLTPGCVIPTDSAPHLMRAARQAVEQ